MAAYKPQRSTEQNSQRSLLGQQDSKVLSILFPVMLVEENEIFDIVSQNRASIAYRIFKLFVVGQSTSINV